ncbi:dystrophin-like [Mercenaria mercenaria]|uniref:dystrophin-like n=1 Tax=Mercenaria mercenaria TaxID=6596 RepID=UPI00234E6EBF|nr:dystrophin-like [Mercenaria mercenaria]
METDFSFYEKIVDGWERTETENCVPYYVNHITESTSWDHPYWLKILEGLKDYNSVKYAAYRTALKIRHIQTQLQLNQVDLYTIQQEFEDLGYMSGSEGVIRCDDLLTLLINIYHSSQGRNQTAEVAGMLADLTLNLLLNIFDKDKSGGLSVMAVKLVLVILSSANLTEKYRYFYQELHDPSTYIGTHALTAFLQAVMKLPDFLHESLAFGRTSEPAVASCQQMGKTSCGITEDVFYKWLQKGPQTIIWLPTLHRLISCETVSHDAKCNICKVYPITGLRYKCLKCFNFNICQNCFFTGKTSKRHTVKHPTQEYCTNSTAKDEAAAFMKTLKNNLSRKHRRKSRIKYLPIEADSQYTNLAWSPGKEERDRDIHTEISETAKKLAELEVEDNTENIPEPQSSPENIPEQQSSPRIPHPASLFTNKENFSPKDDGLQKERDELNAIIRHLEEENRMLYEQMSALQQTSDTESLTSDSNCHHSGHKTPTSSIMHRILRETQNLPVREPLPIEATPIFLSVPIINVNGYQSDSFSISPKSSIYYAPSIQQPDFSPTDSSSSPYPTLKLQRDFTPPNSPPRGLTLADSLDVLDTSPARFSLPSPSKSYDEFNSEEAELRALVNEADQMFPQDLSYGQPKSRLGGSDDDMLRAANSIQTAMSDFVNQAVNIRIPS